MNLNYYKVTSCSTTQLILATDAGHAMTLFEMVYGEAVDVDFIEILIASPTAYYSEDK